jgi:hypothetical protein
MPSISTFYDAAPVLQDRCAVLPARGGPGANLGSITLSVLDLLGGRAIPWNLLPFFHTGWSVRVPRIEYIHIGGCGQPRPFKLLSAPKTWGIFCLWKSLHECLCLAVRFKIPGTCCQQNIYSILRWWKRNLAPTI